MPTLTLRLPTDVLKRINQIAQLSGKKPETVSAVLLAAEVVRSNDALLPAQGQPAIKTKRTVK